MSNYRKFQFYCIECKQKWESSLSHKWRTLYCPNCFDKSQSKTHVVRREILSVYVNCMKRRKNVYTCLTCFKNWSKLSKKSKLEDFLKCPKQCGLKKKQKMKKKKKRIVSPGSIIPGHLRQNLKRIDTKPVFGKSNNKRKRQFSPVEEREIQSVREFLFSLPHGTVSKKIEIIHGVTELQRMLLRHNIHHPQHHQQQESPKSEEDKNQRNMKVVILLSDEIEKLEKMNRKKNLLKREIEAKNKIIEEFRDFVYQENESRIAKDREILNLQMELMLRSNEDMISVFRSSSNRQEASYHLREIKDLKRTISIMREQISDRNDENNEILDLKRTIIDLESRILDLKNEKKLFESVGKSNLEILELRKKVNEMEDRLETGEDGNKIMKENYESEIKSRDLEISKLRNVSEKFKKKSENFICGICLDRQIGISLDCGHVLCKYCAKKMKKCPFDRKVIRKKINLYL